MLALIKDGTVLIQTVAEGGRFEFDGGAEGRLVVSPAVAGWSFEGRESRWTLSAIDESALSAVPAGYEIESRSVVLNEGAPAYSVETRRLPPTFATLDEARAAMREWIDAAADRITGNVPQAERDSWAEKYATASTLIAGGTPPASSQEMLEIEASFTGETVAALSTRIVAKAEKFSKVAGVISGLRRKTDAALAAETDPYLYAAILDAAKLAAQDQAATLGFAL